MSAYITEARLLPRSDPVNNHDFPSRAIPHKTRSEALFVRQIAARSCSRSPWRPPRDARVCPLGSQPHFERRDASGQTLASYPQPLIGAQPVDVALDVKDRVDAFDRFQRDGRDGRRILAAPRLALVAMSSSSKDSRPRCMGSYAVVKLRLLAWSRSLSTSTIEYGQLLPILFHCVDDGGRPVLGPSLRGPGTPFFVQSAWRDIPAAVEAIRQFWMPTGFAPGT